MSWTATRRNAYDGRPFAPCRWSPLFAWLPRWGVCWLRTWRPRSMCRRLTGPTWTVMCSAPTTPMEHSRNLRDACDWAVEEIPTGAVQPLVVEPGTASPIATGGMLPRRRTMPC